MSRTLADTRRWQSEGTALLLASVDALSDSELDAPSTLPDWSRRRVVAHVAANADALLHLVTWAATGVETPMYPSPEARREGIDRGAVLPTRELVTWLRRSARLLEVEMRSLTADQWLSEVVTAQGRSVSATELPWLRARELYVHVVDLGTGLSFTDLADDFLTALREDIAVKRGSMPKVWGSQANVTAWLAGRPHGPVRLADGTSAPELGAWL